MIIQLDRPDRLASGVALSDAPAPSADDRLRQALTAADAGTWEWDATDEELRLSPEMRGILGLDASEAPVDLELLRSVLDPDERPRQERSFRRALARGDRLLGDVRIVGRDGRARWLRLSGRIERDRLGMPRRVAGIALDITSQKRYEQRLRVGESVSRVLATAQSFEEAVPRVLAAIAAGTGMEICGLWLPTPDGTLLQCEQVHAEDEARVRFADFIARTMETRLAPGEGLVGRVWRSREPVWVESVVREHGFEGVRADFVAGIESGVAIPLTSGLALLGVVDVFSSQQAASDELLLDTLAGLGNELGQFILRMRAEAALRQSDEGQRLLVQIMQAHRESDDEDRMMLDAATALGRHLGASRVGFAEVPDERTVTLRPSWSAPGMEALPGTWPTDAIPEAFLTRLREGEAIVSPDIALDEARNDADTGTYSVSAMLTVPIVRAGRWIASLYVHQRDPRQWSTSEVALTHDVAEHTWDAVERARAQAARRESESLAQTIAESSTQAMVMTDARGFILYANAAFLDMTGFDEQATRSRALHELIHHHRPDDADPPEACPIGRALPGGVAMREHEDVFYRRNGSAFPVLCAVSPLRRAGRFDASVIEIRDVSATRAAAEALRASEQRFRATFENAAVGVAHVGVDGRWLRVNDKLCQITGYSEAELLERTFQEITHPDDLAFDEAQARRVLAGEIQTYRLEKRYVRKDGSPAWVELTVSLVRKPSSEPDHFIAIVVDIGIRKLAERRLRSALAAKDEFLGFVSHELRTPMTVILGMSQMLAGERLPAARVHEVALDIASSAQELNELIESMLLLARLDRDSELVSEPLLLGRAAGEVLERQRLNDRSRRYDLETCADSLVHAHPGLVDRVISNLLSNAAKYSVIGGHVHVIVDGDETEISLRVLDQGPGLSEAELGRIFEPFYRTDGAQGAPGLGLGLSVAQRIVEGLGGRIWAKRRTPLGSEFGFALPRMDPGQE